MNPRAPFTRGDLEELGEFLALAERVVPMRDVAKGDTGERVIGLRHDVDDNPGSLETAIRLAEWEARHGIASTYFLLHDSYYWEDVLPAAEAFEELGHEVGIHVNAIAEALRRRRDPHTILDDALAYLRSACRVRGSVAHGDPLCRRKDDSVAFVNDEMFSECRRPEMGSPTRGIALNGYKLRLAQLPLATFGLEYDANWLSRGDYLSDSGGSWSERFEDVAARWPARGQLHMLVHPDWWGEAFVSEEVAA